jgi:two-component system phosphate regulon response regulator PhoB
MSQILVVEDEVDIATLMAFNLEQSNHQVTVVHHGKEALQKLDENAFQLVILDLMLPDMSGIEVCRQMRQHPTKSQIPVMMVTAKGEEFDRVLGFESGADDYLVKPFSPRELVLRVHAILRRAETPLSVPSEVFSFGQLSIDVAAHRATVKDQEVRLTALEFRLLLDMASRAGRVQTRDALLERVWGYSAGVETRTVDTHVKRLREKLGSAGKHVETVRGVGYRMSYDESTAG